MIGVVGRYESRKLTGWFFSFFFLSSNDQERGKCSSLVLANLPIFFPEIQATWGMETSTEVVQR